MSEAKQLAKACLADLYFHLTRSFPLNGVGESIYGAVRDNCLRDFTENFEPYFRKIKEREDVSNTVG